MSFRSATHLARRSRRAGRHRARRGSQQGTRPVAGRRRLGTRRPVDVCRCFGPTGPGHSTTGWVPLVDAGGSTSTDSAAPSKSPYVKIHDVGRQFSMRSRAPVGSSDSSVRAISIPGRNSIGSTIQLARGGSVDHTVVASISIRLNGGTWTVDAAYRRRTQARLSTAHNSTTAESGPE